MFLSCAGFFARGGIQCPYFEQRLETQQLGGETSRYVVGLVPGVDGLVWTLVSEREPS